MKQVLANAVVAGSIYSLVALGFSLIWSVRRFFHFAHGAVYTLGAYSAYVAVKLLHFPLLVGVLTGVFVAAVCGVAMEALVFRNLSRRGATPAVLLLSSLGLLTVVQNCISLVFADHPRVFRAGELAEGVDLFTVRLTQIQIAILIANIALVALTWTFLHRTQLGKVIRAVANDPSLAKVHGINVDRAILFVFAAASAMAAIAGILIGLDTDITPAMGFNALLMGAAAAIIGGFGSVTGAWAGGLLVGIVQHLGVVSLPTEWQDAIVFVLVITFLIFRPQGFFGRSIRTAEI